MRLFAGLATVMVALGAVLAVAEPYRFARLAHFADPFADKLGGGYQAVQGLYALGSGGWFGVGLGASRQKWTGYLPNAHTDYIFGIIGEELGLVGTLVVLLLFAVLVYAGLRVSQRTKDPFVRLGAAGITAWIAVQAIVNMGAVTGLLPITGIPLPLVSFGGSSLAMSMLAIGVLASFARSEPGVAEVLAARGPSLTFRVRRWARAYYGFLPVPKQRGRDVRRPGPAARGR
jgi:cell division protein FtsW